MQTNYDKIIIMGKEYYLVPVEEPVSESLIEGYTGVVAQRPEQRPVEAKTEGSIPSNPAGKRDAVPKLSEYRERYKKHQVLLTDIQVPPKIIRDVAKPDADLKRFVYDGEELFFGRGIEQEF